jgi:hypothetical protein
LPSLRDLQARFARALDGDPAAPANGDADAADGEVDAAHALACSDGGAAPPDDLATLFRDDGLPAHERVAIYANNSRAAFGQALALTFPVTKRLGGEAWFAGAAGSYRRAHPSRSGDLQHAGERFPAFLAARLAGTAHEVIADVAALEWACECAAAAPDGVPLDLAALAGVPADRHGQLRFELQPACRLVASPFPVVDVWEAHGAAGEPPAVDLDAGAQYALVLRRDDVEVHRVDAATFAFLQGLDAGETLEGATAGAIAIDADFRLAEWLPRLAALGVLGPARPTA